MVSMKSLMIAAAAIIPFAVAAPVDRRALITAREASTSGSCEGQGNSCVGDITHWDGGLGACGWTVDSNSEMAVALPAAFMGTQSNGNPYCGRSITVLNPATGKTITGTVGDKCMGCVDRAIDLTNSLFTAITDGTGDGREPGFQWWLN